MEQFSMQKSPSVVSGRPHAPMNMMLHAATASRTDQVGVLVSLLLARGEEVPEGLDHRQPLGLDLAQRVVELAAQASSSSSSLSIIIVVVAVTIMFVSSSHDYVDDYNHLSSPVGPPSCPHLGLNHSLTSSTATMKG
jgi:hypothetical protein